MNDEGNSAPISCCGSDSCPLSPDSISSGELLPISNEEADKCNVFNYTDERSFSAVIHSVLANDVENLKRLVLQGNSLRVVDNNGDTPLHHAVKDFTPEKMDVLKYLLSIDDIDLDAVNHVGMTPLLLSCMNLKEIASFLLMQAGADINIATFEYVTPLHYAARFSSNLSEALILRGADINVIDANMDTPLHYAVSLNASEVVSMLLFYNVDANVTNADGFTPFMQSLSKENTGLADELFEYVTDFNLIDFSNSSTLHLAISCNYSRIIEMMERGANVNYDGNKECYLFLGGCRIDIETFRYIWKHFNYKRGLGKLWPHVLITVLNNTSYSPEYKLQVIDIVLSCENAKKMLRLTKDSEKYPIIHPFVNRLYKMNVLEEDVHKYCATLLSHGLIVYDTDLDMVYERFGYCELFKLLLEMPIRVSGFKQFNLFPYIIYQMCGDFNYVQTILDHRFKTSYNNSLDNLDYENLMNHTVKFQMLRYFETEGIDPISCRLHKYISAFPVVPKLQELAIFEIREFLRNKHNIKTCRRFYAVLKGLYIPTILKKLIAFEIPLYAKYGSDVAFIKAWIEDRRQTYINELDKSYY